MTRPGKSFFRWFCGVSLALVVAANVLSCVHARSMIRWIEVTPGAHGSEKPAWLGQVDIVLTGIEIPKPVDGRTPESAGLQFAEHRFPNGVGDELAAWYIPADSTGVVFVVFHGYAASKSFMIPVAKALHDLGRPTLLVDFHGSGGSSGRNTTLGVREAHDVAAAVDFCRRQWPRDAVVVYGQSMGGAAALRAVARHGAAPDGLIVESVFARLLDAVRWRVGSLGMPSWPAAELVVFWGGLTTGFNGFAHRPVDDAADVACPTLVLHGSRDPQVSSDEAAAIFDALAGWRRYLEVEPASHCSVFSVGNDEWRREIHILLERIGADD